MHTNRTIENSPAANSRAKAKVIAVGGAKGGIGKSLLAANLGVYLANQGWRTTVVDMDLGAANLHLYLGIWGLEHRIDDYLDKKVGHLEQIAIETAYGTRLIGGGSSRLGSANLPFARKIKLMRAIRNLDADFVIIDLGGDTAFNVLDFFLLADHGLVLTTCDPASYLDAYTFVKMALHRRLTRLFSPESNLRKFKDHDLVSVIDHHVGPDAARNGGSGKIEDLLQAVSRNAPARQYLVENAIEQFQPQLIVNMVDAPDEVDPLVTRFKKVAGRMLSINVPFLGSIPADRRIARSTHDLVPEVARNPNGILSEFLEQMTHRL